MDKFENGVPKIEKTIPYTQRLNGAEESALRYLTKWNLYKEDVEKKLELARQKEEVGDIIKFQDELKKAKEEIETGKGLLKAIDENRKGYDVAQQLAKEASRDFKEKKD